MIALPQYYSISTDKQQLNVDVIHWYLSTQSYWAQYIPKAVVERSIENSLCFGVYYKKEQIGFARVITDYAVFSYLADVFILEEHRGKGLSKNLMQYIMHYPALQGLRVMSLRTRDAHGLYMQFGFKPALKPENVMEIKYENFYKAPGT